MAKIAIVPFSMLGGGRWDAQFLIKAVEMMKARGVKPAEVKKISAILKELNDRNEFPKGHTFVKAPAHFECAECFSWEVDYEEIEVTKVTNGLKSISRSGSYKCLQCGHGWRTEAGVNQQVQ